MTILISKVPYGTFADYSPRGTSEKSRKSQDLCGRIKQANPATIQNFIDQLIKPENRKLFKEFLGPEITLIPSPRSSPIVKGGLWPGHELAQSLVDAGLGKEVIASLRRVTAVPKSASAGKGNRPDVQTHFDSFEVRRSLIIPDKITIIDDVLTLGRTLFAGALRLHEAYPKAEIRAFAFIRTMGLVPDVEKIANPSVSEIYQTGGGGCNRTD